MITTSSHLGILSKVENSLQRLAIESHSLAGMPATIGTDQTGAVGENLQSALHQTYCQGAILPSVADMRSFQKERSSIF